jgi:co-chaperonin GroES (HSP10)
MHSTQAIDYTQGATPTEAYDRWKAEWTPPQRIPMALYGRCIVEFSPYAHASESGRIFTPEQASYQAMVIDDSTGELLAGQEVMLAALQGQNFRHEGRILCVVDKEDILGILE